MEADGADTADATTRLQPRPADGNRSGTRGGTTASFWLAVVASALGSAFQHGYNTGVINSPKEVISNWLIDNYKERNVDLNPTKVDMLWSLIVSIFCVGGMIGALGTGYASNRFGRKGGLMLNNFFAVLAGVLEGFAPLAGSPEMLIIGRFFVGLNCGLNAGLAPMYLTEISPVHLRGMVGSMYQLVVTISILVSQLLSLGSVLGTANGWGWLLGLTVLPAVFQLLVLPFCPESPRFTLINRGQDDVALQDLTKLRGSAEVQEEINEMKAETEAARQQPRVTIPQMFTSQALRMPLVIAAVMMLAQQLSGINAVMFYSTSIFGEAGLSNDAAQYATLGVGIVNVVMTVISVVMVEKAGRKTLMQIGMIGMTVVCVMLTITIRLKDNGKWLQHVSVLLVVVFVVFFATGPGSIPWFIVGELFNQSARPTATSIAVAINWTANFVIGIGFLPLKNLIDAYVFLTFPVALVVFIIFTWKYVPETKNKSIDEITAYFRQNN